MRRKLVFAFHKIKSRMGVRALLAHNFRHDNSKNVDTSKTKLNMYPKDRGRDIIRTMLDYQRNLKGHKPRKNAVWAHEYVISGSHSHMTDMSRKECLQYFTDSINFFREMYGKESMLIPSVHFDEQTVHMHLIIQPMKDGKLNGKAFTGGSKHIMAQMRSTFQQKVAAKYGLEYGSRNCKATPQELSEHYEQVQEELPRLKAENRDLRHDLNRASRQLTNTVVELAGVRKELDDAIAQTKLLKRNISDLERLREKSHTLTRVQLDNAIQRLDEQEHRPAFRRH